MTADQRSALETLRRQVRTWATINLCGHTVYSDRTTDYDDNSQCPLNGGTWSCTNAGRDSNLIHGLLCASGEPFFCESARQAQDESGKWWRSPLAAVTKCEESKDPVNADNLLNCVLGQNCDFSITASFSRDHSIGSLLYLASTHDAAAASRWRDYMAAPRKYDPIFPLGNLFPHSGTRALCHDDLSQTGDFCSLWAVNKQFEPSDRQIRECIATASLCVGASVVTSENPLDCAHQAYGHGDCTFIQNSSEFLGLFQDTFQNVGVSSGGVDFNPKPQDPVADRAAYACHGAQSRGWRMNLVAYEYLLDQILTGRKRNVSSGSDPTGEECIANYQGGTDPSLRFIREGASSEVADLVLQSCPAERPPLLNGRAGWQWANIGGTAPNGWDCMLMLNLLLGPDPDASRWEAIYSSAPDYGSFAFVYSGAFVPVLF